MFRLPVAAQLVAAALRALDDRAAALIGDLHPDPFEVATPRLYRAHIGPSRRTGIAAQRRAAQKRRNVLRNRRAHKGAR